MPNVVLSSLLLPILVAAQSPSPNATAAVRAAIETYRQAMNNRDLAAMRQVFHPDLLVFEMGGVNRGRSDYLEHHLGPELKELKSWKTGPANTAIEVDGKLAVAIADFTYEATMLNGKTSRGVATETLVLALTPDGWKIRHLHWSSHAVKAPGK